MSVLALTVLFGLWLAQDLLSAYWQEHYYRAYPLAWLERFALWRSGSLLHDRAAARWADNHIANNWSLMWSQKPGTGDCLLKTQDSA